MRKLTDNDLANIAGSTVEGYKVEAVRVKRGDFSDSDHYGIILGKNAGGNYVTWQFHLLDDDSVSVYWGHYFAEDREAALRDYDTRDLGIDKDAAWSKYLRYLRDWADGHGDSGFYGTAPACFDEWFGNEYQTDEAGGQENKSRGYKVTITETLKLTVDIEAGSRNEAEQIVSDSWRNSEYVLDSDNFVGVEFNAVPLKQPKNECPLGGDTDNGCADCFYAGDYHYHDGQCERNYDC